MLRLWIIISIVTTFTTKAAIISGEVINKQDFSVISDKIQYEERLRGFFNTYNEPIFPSDVIKAEEMNSFFSNFQHNNGDSFVDGQLISQSVFEQKQNNVINNMPAHLINCQAHYETNWQGDNYYPVKLPHGNKNVYCKEINGKAWMRVDGNGYTFTIGSGCTGTGVNNATGLWSIDAINAGSVSSDHGGCGISVREPMTFTELKIEDFYRGDTVYCGSVYFPDTKLMIVRDDDGPVLDYYRKEYHYSGHNYISKTGSYTSLVNKAAQTSDLSNNNIFTFNTEEEDLYFHFGQKTSSCANGTSRNAWAKFYVFQEYRSYPKSCAEAYSRNYKNENGTYGAGNFLLDTDIDDNTAPVLTLCN